MIIDGYVADKNVRIYCHIGPQIHTAFCFPCGIQQLKRIGRIDDIVVLRFIRKYSHLLKIDRIND